MACVLPVLVNRSGEAALALGDALSETIAQAFAQTGRRIALELVEPQDMRAAIKRHAGAPVLVVGGGDGTIGTAAATLVNSMTALAILPLGKRNCLARHFGVPTDLGEAAQLAVTGQRRRIDLGLAGDRVFVSSATFGLYTRFIRERRSGASSGWQATLRAAWHMIKHMRAQFFALRVDGKPSEVATPLLFVANNDHALNLPHAAESEGPGEHLLSLCALPDKGAFEMVGLAVRALFGMRQPSGEFLEYGRAGEIVIEGMGAIEGTFDGDPMVLPLPLRLRALPSALGIVTPREAVPHERTLTHIH